jgi:hypothetical protein
VDTGVDWIDFTEDDLKKLAKRAKKARWKMKEEQFDPTPKPSYCKFCDYETVCPARKEQRLQNIEKRRQNDPLEKKVDGVVDLGFDFVD